MKAALLRQPKKSFGNMFGRGVRSRSVGKLLRESPMLSWCRLLMTERRLKPQSESERPRKECQMQVSLCQREGAVARRVAWIK